MSRQLPLRPTLLAIAAFSGLLGVVAGHGTIVASERLASTGTIPMDAKRPAETPATPAAPQAARPIKVPNPPEDESGKVLPETPKVGSRDAPGG